MAQNPNKKQVEQITDMEVDFAQWYTDVCKDVYKKQGYG